MNISADTLNEFISSWDESLEWTDEELQTIREHLLSISLNNGGRIHYDVALEQEVKENYILKTINTAIQKAMNLFAMSIGHNDHGNEYYRVPLKGLSPAFDFNEPMKYIPKIDLNRASPEELESLPGIGPVTARRIIEYRKQGGLFEDIADVTNVQGIDKSDFEKFKYAVYVSVPSEAVSFVSPSLLQFKSEPSFPNYIELIKGSGGAFTFWGEAIESSSPKSVILRALGRIDEYISKNHFPAFNKYRRVRASKILEVHEQQQLARQIEESASDDIVGVTVLDDAVYYYFLKEALPTAQERIWVIMFFMAYEDAETYPTYQLIQELVSAKGRGVDVKVILDKDAEGQVYGSRVINEEAYEKFKENGIEVVYDAEEKVTHTKIILIDDRHVIIGSHNWTAGSFFAYDDKSIYVESPGLATKTSEYFDSLWTEYTADS